MQKPSTCQRYTRRDVYLIVGGRLRREITAEEIENPESNALPRLAAIDCRSRAERFAYLRVAQTYMLISMPTCTSTIFGVFQVIRLSQVFVQVFGATLAPSSG
jgi:hypothetical protein